MSLQHPFVSAASLCPHDLNHTLLRFASLSQHLQESSDQLLDQKSEDRVPNTEIRDPNTNSESHKPNTKRRTPEEIALHLILIS